MKRTISAILIVIALGLITGLSSPKNRPKVTLLSNQITQINNYPAPATSNRGPQDEWKIINMRVTAYCPCAKCCGHYADWTTASGHKIQPGEVFIAADKQYPFGTEMRIPGYNDDKPVKVLDRGSAIRDNRIDVFFTSHRQALDWGVKILPVQILKK